MTSKPTCVVTMVVSLLCLALQSPAAEAKPNAWVTIRDDAFKAADGKPAAPIAGGVVFVNRVNGDVFLSAWNVGVWKSADQGQTFVRVDGGKISGNGSGPFLGNAVDSGFDGKKIAVFNMNNAPGPSGCSLDGGQTWTAFTSVERNWDFGAIEPGEGKTVLGARHEADGLHYSADLGRTWTQLAKSRFHPVVTGMGVFSPTELVLAYRYKIERSSDAGKTWSRVSDLGDCSGPMLTIKGVAYWFCRRGLVVSADKGKTWAVQGVPPPARPIDGYPPCPGKDEQHFVVPTVDGFCETTDGGKSWKFIAPLPEGVHLGDWQESLAFDPLNNLLYVTNKGKAPVQYALGSGAVFQPAPKPAPAPIAAKAPEGAAALDEEFAQLQKSAGNGPVVRVKRLEKAQDFTGKIDDMFERNATPLTFRFTDGANGQPVNKTTAWLVSDQDNLYIAIRAETPDPQKVLTKITERDDDLWNDESIEFCLDPTNTRTQAYFHIIVNSAGVTYDESDSKDLTWNPRLTVKCGKEPGKAWIVEMKIPFADLGIKPDQLNRIWTFNMNRTAYDSTDPSKYEDTAWSPTHAKSSNVPQRFGYLLLEAGNLLNQ